MFLCFLVFLILDASIGFRASNFPLSCAHSHISIPNTCRIAYHSAISVDGSLPKHLSVSVHGVESLLLPPAMSRILRSLMNTQHWKNRCKELNKAKKASTARAASAASSISQT
ncbi:hypothetical protein K438DRAFT_1163939 [Mycena galopus ATCC 62051]|nr:hypothetical protein K438DRAFT_1163939 [Mycena galopus ATCC 62051]